jgi:hypothetical protein
MNGSNNGTVQYGVPVAAKQADKRPRAGRRCAFGGCVTLLSTYNSSPTCWLHTTAVPRHPLASTTQLG